MTSRHLTPVETARRLGVSAKALRVYEARGLVCPQRTEAGWRVYGPAQIARLHQVLALKGFGLSLQRIAELLSGRTVDIGAFLELQEAALRRRNLEVERALLLVMAARGRLARGETLSPDDLTNLTRETIMSEHTGQDSALSAAFATITDKHLTAEERALMAANGYRGMGVPDPVWEKLVGEATALMATHAAVSPEAMDLARRWMAQVGRATGGDGALNRKVRDMAREALEDPVVQAEWGGASLAMMDYVGAAYGGAIAAGVMPKP